MDSETRNLQNDFFNAARKSRLPVTVFLNNGKKLIGKLKSFDKFTLLLESHQGELIVFKHAISSVSPVSRPVSEGAGDAERRAPATAGRAQD